MLNRKKEAFVKSKRLLAGFVLLNLFKTGNWYGNIIIGTKLMEK